MKRGLTEQPDKGRVLVRTSPPGKETGVRLRAL
jgi:hypothetical protein